MKLDESRVEALRAAGRLTEAARLCAEAGAHARAAALYEEACEFAAAAEQALSAGDPRKALRLAALSGDEALGERACRALLAAGDVEVARRTAADLGARGHHRHAAVLLREVGDLSAAAQAFERDGDAAEAARCHEGAGQAAQAARVLEAALREGAPEPDHLRAMLGALYERHGKHRAAVRVLQQLPPRSHWRIEALAPLARSLEALDLRQALSDLRPELARHGVDLARPPAEPSSPQAKLYGRYRVVAEVAVTPHARLLEAVDELTGQRVAVKILAARARGSGRDALARFVREARALTQLRHPNVVPLADFVPQGPALVLHWMAGGSLRDLLDREAVSPARAAEIARAVLSALAEAHRLGILHRDVKPSNLLFDEGGTARLADFGAAHMSESEATVTAGEIGTVAYMAPEQRMGKAASVQSDVYAVGVLLYEMLSGALPPLAGPRPPLTHPDLDAAHDALVDRFLAEDPHARFRSALEARDAIDALAWSARLGAHEPPPRPAQAPGAAPAAAAAGGRLRPDPARAGWFHDEWLGREVLVLPLDDVTMRRAAAIARAGHPALPLVMRADRAEKTVWVEPPQGEPMMRGSALDARHLERLGAALEALHRAGGAHGAVDEAHVVFRGDEAHLTWSGAEAADAESDLRALAALGAR